MGDLTAGFDAWVDSLEKGAAQMDGAAVERFIAEGERWCERLSADDVALETKEHARIRLATYRDICDFLQRALRQSLAARTQQSNQPALIGKYG